MSTTPTVIRTMPLRTTTPTPITERLAARKQQPAPVVLYVHRRELPGYERYEFRWEHLVEGATGLAIAVSTGMVMVLILWALARSMGVL